MIQLREGEDPSASFIAFSRLARFPHPPPAVPATAIIRVVRQRERFTEEIRGFYKFA
jgi:hypothetical protein